MNDRPDKPTAKPTAAAPPKRTHAEALQSARLDAAVRLIESFNTLLATQKPGYNGRSKGLDDEQSKAYSAALKTVRSFM